MILNKICPLILLLVILTGLTRSNPFMPDEDRNFEAPHLVSNSLEFLDVTKSVGLEFTHEGRIPQREPRSAVIDQLSGLAASVAVGDYNQDGFQDLIVTSPVKGGSRLFRNMGGTRFQDVTEREIPDLSQLEFPTAAAWIDFNEDQKVDLIVGTTQGVRVFLNSRKPANTLTLRNDLAFETHFAVANINLVDFDKDGRLDVILSAFWRPNIEDIDVANLAWNFWKTGGGVRIYRAIGKGHFNKVFESQSKPHVVSTALTKIDETGDLLFITGNDYERLGLFFHVNGKWEERSALAKERDTGRWNSGLSVGDLDGDGLQDIYESNTFAEPYYKSQNLVLNLQPSGDSFVHHTWPIRKCGFSWGSLIEDLDLDGRPEVVVATGLFRSRMTQFRPDLLWTVRMTSRTTPFFWRKLTKKFDWARFSAAGYQRKCLFSQNEDGHWRDIGLATGLNVTFPTRTVAKIDFNNDGAFDLVFLSFNGPLVLFQNQRKLPHKWVGLTFKDAATAFGAEVKWRFRDREIRQVNWPANGTSVLNDSRLVLPVDAFTSSIQLIPLHGKPKSINLEKVNAYVEIN